MLRYHLRDGRITVTYRNERVGIVERNADGTFDAITIKPGFQLPNVTRTKALAYFRQFDWPSIVGACYASASRIKYEPKLPRTTFDRWDRR